MDGICGGVGCWGISLGLLWWGTRSGTAPATGTAPGSKKERKYQEELSKLNYCDHIWKLTFLFEVNEHKIKKCMKYSFRIYNKQARVQVKRNSAWQKHTFHKILNEV